jgi:hypothetical protein
MAISIVLFSKVSKDKRTKTKKKQKNFETFLCKHIFKNHSHYIFFFFFKNTACPQNYCWASFLSFFLAVSIFSPTIQCLGEWRCHALNYLIRSPFKVTKGKKMSFKGSPYLKSVGSCPICILENFFLKLRCKRRI